MDNLLLTVGAAIGALALGRVVFGLANTLANAYLIPGKSLKEFGTEKVGKWAVVTGASDGIGREFVLQLASQGLKVLLISRNQSKLDAVASEAKTECKTLSFDFASASADDYARLAKVVEGLDGGVAVLINNVGVNHEFPVPFLDETTKTADSIVEVNILAQMRITRIVAPLMVSAKKGLIVNIGSLAGIVPSGYLSVYSASKSFLRFWSIALAKELAPSNVHVEHMRAFFVVTNMSKIRKPTWTTPTAKQFVKAALKNVGKSIDSTPYPSHAIINWILSFVPESFLVDYSNQMHIDIRKRALKKKEREAAAAKKE
ncbi:3-ketoacyl-CoA reductase [Chytriomyces sp. MP71]|nr:3-ketoacyl-CoA reductase [Chytriomyces sp. MP71]